MAEELEELRKDVEQLRNQVRQLDKRITGMGATVGAHLNDLEAQVERLRSHVDPSHG